MVLEKRESLKDYPLGALQIAKGLGGILIFMFIVYGLRKLTGR